MRNVMHTVRVQCPLCEWYYDRPPTPTVPTSLQSVFGPGVLEASFYAQTMQQCEQALDKHLRSHDLLDWVKKVGALQRRVQELEDEINRDVDDGK